MTVEEVRRAAEDADEGLELRGDLDRQRRDVDPPQHGEPHHLHLRREGAVAKPALRGRSGPVSVTCRPSAARGFSALTAASSAASPSPSQGAAVITDVALRRPARMSWRMPRLMPGAMP